MTTRPLFYVLKDGKPVPESDPQARKAFLEDITNRRVDATWLETHEGSKVEISTVFLGIACGDDDGEPVLWQTMILWPRDNQVVGWRRGYTSEKAARAGHQEVVAFMKVMFGRMKQIAEGG